MGESAGTSGQSSIAAMLLETASSVLQSSVPEGFEWVQEYGMYYSPTTRYFYDMNTGLFYHSDSQTYYYFDEATGSYCVYANMQKKKWSRSRHQKRAVSLLGETELQRYGQDEVDICELLFSTVDKVVDMEWEKECEQKYGRRHKEREKDRHRRHERRERDDKRKREKERERDRDRERERERERERRHRKHKSKRAKYDGDEVYMSSEEDEATKIERSAKNGSDGHSSSGVEENGDDERIQMMREEGYLEAPLLRIIDQLGHLHIVTIEGAWVGSHPEATIRFDSLAELHAEIYYDPGDQDRPHGYQMRVLVTDASTSLDGHQLEENDEVMIQHGSWFTAGDVILIIHVHYGMNNCAKCDPGQMKPIEKKIEKLPKPINGRGNAARLKALNAMKKQYGVTENEPSEARYVDRAAMRRQEVGSEYPVIQQVIRRGRADPNDIYSNCAARPVPGAMIAKPKTMDTPIEAENKGFKLLKAMGWQEGKGLGKEQAGRAEPVAVVQKSDRAGLGTQGKEAPKSHKQMMMDVMRKRFDEITEREK